MTPDRPSDTDPRRPVSGARDDARFRALVQHATDIITIVDDDGIVRYESPAIERVLGHPAHASLGAQVFAGVHPDDAYRAWSYLTKVHALPDHHEPVELRYRHRDGGWRWLELRATNLLHDPGVNGIVFNSRDITAAKEAAEQLRRQGQQLAALVENAPDVISRVDRELRYVYANPAIEAATGLPVAVFIGHTGADLHAPTTVGAYWRAARNVFDTRREQVVEFDYPTPHGRRWFQARLIPEVNADGAVETVLSIARDITDLKQAEEQLREAEARYRTLVEHMPAVTYIDQLTNVSNVAWVSPQIEQLLGYAPAELLADGGFFLTRLHPDDRERVTAALAESNRTLAPCSLEYRMLARDGRVVWVRDEGVVVRDAAGQPRYWQGILLDVTGQKELEEQLAHRAFHDPLTDLPNRALFNDRLEHALARAVRGRGLLAVLFLDLDDFKDINDTFGHEAGDRVLIEVAERVRGTLRLGDSAARFGGDEFMVLLEDLSDPEEAECVADRLARVIAEPFEIEGQHWRVTASIGVALSRGGEEPASELLRRADAEMYHVKARGGQS